MPCLSSPAALQADPKNMQPFAPFGFEGIFNGAAFVFFSFIGFDVSCCQPCSALVSTGSRQLVARSACPNIADNHVPCMCTAPVYYTLRWMPRLKACRACCSTSCRSTYGGITCNVYLHTLRERGFSPLTSCPHALHHYHPSTCLFKC